MSRLTNALGRVRVAAPCEEDWDEMRGDERVRFCQRCSLNVYNLSAMTRREAERLVVENEGRLCVRFYRRKDGTILTQNCPTGLIKLKRRVARAASATAAAAFGLFTGVAAAPEAQQAQPPEVEAAFALPEPVVATMPVTQGGAVAVGSEEEMTAGVEASDGEAFTITEGAMSLDPAGQFAPLALIGGLFTLLTWPLLFLLSDRDEESGRERLRIWSNDWTRRDENVALPREGSAVEPNQ